jgi:hypothetical protein
MSHNLILSEMRLKKIYHGSPIEINDIYIATGTYFTDDINVAMDYGNYIYSIDFCEKIKSVMKLDCFKEHYINIRLIPIYLFEIQKWR